MKLLLVLLISSASFGQRVTCKTCNLVEVKRHKLVRVIEFVAPVALGIGIGRAFAPSVPPKVQNVPVFTNPKFCIVGQTC